ncbi:DciA family protein [Bifidobacterium choloepi]|uniref:DUF721 domain-containing protein n=1 Tax=Bifidobacterium choloepi TaxID=2614131 RepID=A0A6I5N0E7_9BIFI|nr:DUF721 domain-containing protein [Bifidobacterium choloepi]NEG69986.1 DUF721 domain-containing protein [Bifidobacterium choloepi]
MSDGAPIAERLGLDERKLPAQVFERLAKRAGLVEDWRRRNEEARENFGKAGRDPNRIGGVLEAFAVQKGWGRYLGMTRLMEAWPEIAGPVAAAHTQVDSLVDGVLKIRANTPAWEQQMSGLSGHLLAKIQATHPEFGIRRLEVIRAPKRQGRGRLRPVRNG